MKNISKDYAMQIINETIEKGCQILPVNESITRFYGKDIEITVSPFDVLIEKLNEEKLYCLDYVNNRSGFFEVFMMNR